jgi:hypothetical protein
MAYFGNTYITPTQSYVYGLNSFSKKYCFRFTVQNTGTISSIFVYVYQINGTSPTYRIGLQANGYLGRPSGTWLGASNLGYKEKQFVYASWNELILGESVSVTAGDIIHIVFDYLSGTINTSNNIYLTSQTTPSQLLDSYDCSADNAQAVLRLDGSTWTTFSTNPIYYVETVKEGMSNYFYNTYSVGNLFGNTQYCEKVVMTETVTISTIEFQTRKSGSPADDLYYEIEDSIGTVLRSGTLVTAAASSSTMGWVGTTLASTLELSSGSTYRFILKSPGSASSSNCYKIYWAHHTYSAYTSWLGQNNCLQYSTNSGSTWGSYTGSDLAFRCSPDASSTTTSTSSSTSSTSTSTTSTSTTTISTSSTSSSTTSSSTTSSSTTSSSTSSTSSTSSSISTSSTSSSTSSTSSTSTTISFTTLVKPEIKVIKLTKSSFKKMVHRI